MKLAVIGAGSRGRAYSSYAEKYPFDLEITAVAEPDAFRRKNFGNRFGISDSLQFHTVDDLLHSAPEVDAVLITTPDQTHIEIAEKCSEAGYHILLEKPIATSMEELKRIYNIIKPEKNLFGVCHVLLHTPLTKAVKAIVQSGTIGQIVSIQRLEPIGYWHFMHSYVRGNWRREDSSSSLLLAKSCHDIDWIMHIMGSPVTSVSSFGSLYHFTSASAPNGASSRCIECSVESSCPFSAIRFYRKALAEGREDWPLDTVVQNFTSENLDHELIHGSYGRCVYASDNTVMDNQVVNMKFEGGKTASFTVVAFSDVDYRKTRIFGTDGMLEIDGKGVSMFRFLENEWSYTPVGTVGNATAARGHGGGDYGLMKAYIAAWQSGDYQEINRKTVEGCLSHQVVFAAEIARKEERVVKLNEFSRFNLSEAGMQMMGKIP